MPETTVNGVSLNYEVIGDCGPWIALNPGSRRNYSELLDISRKLAAGGYRVLLHDRRNCGASEVAFDGRAAEYEIWADDLHELARRLGASPCYAGGASAGARLAILMAIRHPESVKGLLLWRVTGGETAARRLAQRYYGDFLELAQKHGMAAVAETDHFREVIAARPPNREAILNWDVNHFCQVMRTWSDHMLAAAELPVMGATEDELRSITVPICIIAGNDVVHHPRAARRMAEMLPRAELHEGIVEVRSEDNLRDSWDEGEWKAQEDRLAATFLAFLERSEREGLPDSGNADAAVVG